MRDIDLTRATGRQRVSTFRVPWRCLHCRLGGGFTQISYAHTIPDEAQRRLILTIPRRVICPVCAARMAAQTPPTTPEEPCPVSPAMPR